MEAMMNEVAEGKAIIDAPRIKVELTLADGGDIDSGPYDAWLILHVPDGKPPVTVRIDGPKSPPRSSDDALLLMLELWGLLGEKFAFPREIMFPHRLATH